jgi:hypothetical protein
VERIHTLNSMPTRFAPNKRGVRSGGNRQPSNHTEDRSGTYINRISVQAHKSDVIGKPLCIQGGISRKRRIGRKHRSGRITSTQKQVPLGSGSVRKQGLLRAEKKFPP